MLWYVFGTTDKAYIVEADTSDEALQKGRHIDPSVCATQVYKPEFTQCYTHHIIEKIPKNF